MSVESWICNKYWLATREWIEEHGVEGKFGLLGRTLLAFAVVYEAPLDLVEFIWSKNPSVIHATDRNDTTALFGYPNPDVTEFLLEKGSDPNVLSDGNIPVLCYFVHCYMGNEDNYGFTNVALLLKYGANPHFKVNGEHTVFHYIIEKMQKPEEGIDVERAFQIGEFLHHTWTLFVLAQTHHPRVGPKSLRLPLDMFRTLKRFLL